MFRPTFRASTLVGLCLISWGMLLGSPLLPAARGAEETQETTAGKAIPLAVVNVASVERLLQDVEYMFDAAGRPELSESIAFLLARARDLKGMDRDQPFGFMVFLPPGGLLVQPNVVGFVPVQNVDDLMETIAVGRLTTRKVPDQENRYEIVRGDNTLHVRMQRGYAFVTEDEAALDYEFPDPASFTRPLSRSYDFAFSLNFKQVPELIRTASLDFLRAGFESQLQQRDNESDGRYRIRKARGLSLFGIFEQVVTQGEELTIGWNVSRENQDARLELRVKAKPESEFAESIQNISRRRSEFTNLLAESVPLTIAASWSLNPSGKKTFTEILTGAQMELAAQLPETSDATRQFEKFFQPLLATSEAGHIDLIVRFIGTSSGKLVMVGGLKIADGDTFAAGLVEMLQHFQDNLQEVNLELNVASHKQVAFHRLQTTRTNAREERIYGGPPALYMGAGPNEYWWAIGGDAAWPTLTATMDTVAEPSEPGEQRDLEAPFQILTRLRKWLELFQDSEDRNPVRTLAEQAFTPETDRLRIDIRPTENGARILMKFDEGFIRFVGLAIASRMDQRQQ